MGRAFSTEEQKHVLFNQEALVWFINICTVVLDGSKPLAICVSPLGSSTSTLELVFDSLLGCVVPDGQLQKLTNVN